MEKNFFSDIYARSKLLLLGASGITKHDINYDIAKQAAVNFGGYLWTPTARPGINNLILERIILNRNHLVFTRIESWLPQTVCYKSDEDYIDEVLVLYGSVFDSENEYKSGSYLLRDNVVSQKFWTTQGCLIYSKSIKKGFYADSLSSIECGSLLRSHSYAFVRLSNNSYLLSFNDDYIVPLSWFNFNVEILILSGVIHQNEKKYTQGFWIRFPISFVGKLSMHKGCRIFLRFF